MRSPVARRRFRWIAWEMKILASRWLSVIAEGIRKVYSEPWMPRLRSSLKIVLRACPIGGACLPGIFAAPPGEPNNEKRSHAQNQQSRPPEKIEKKKTKKKKKKKKTTQQKKKEKKKHSPFFFFFFFFFF